LRGNDRAHADEREREPGEALETSCS
jgi:hypothetical protein